MYVAWREGRLTVRYFDHLFPLDPATVPIVFRFGLKQLEDKLPPHHPAVADLCELLEKLEALPRRATRLRSHVDLAIDHIESWLSTLAQIVASSPLIQQWIEETGARFGAGEDGRTRLRKLLRAQNYRLVYWRRAATAINYRRFFDIDDLISLRQEDPRVFKETHETLGRWHHDGWIDGFRVDHLDGLRDPRGYVERLSDMLSVDDSTRAGHMIFVEKILAHGEQLRACWPVDGTTGYGYLNQIESVLISPEGFAEIETNFRRLLRRRVSFDVYARWGKRRVLRRDLSAYVSRLADILVRLARESITSGWAAERVGRVSTVPPLDDLLDGSVETSMATQTTHEAARLTKRQLADAIVEVAVALPVYRTYITPRAELHPDDRRYLKIALAVARGTLKAVPAAVDFLEDILLLRWHKELPDHIRQQHVNFIQRFQQLTGPAAAKGIEDTAHYAYVPLASRNEVGGAPNTPLTNAVAVLHESNRTRAIGYPGEMLCATTHDSKRSGDVRARLDVLSEMPRLWNGYVNRWRRRNHRYRRRVRGKMAPDQATEYLFYQSIIGIWPAPDPRRSGLDFPAEELLQQLCSRLEAYMLKAVREAKTRTSWVNGDQQYEEAVSSFVHDCFRMDPGGPNAFLRDINALVARIARPGFWNSLSRIVLQYTSPGTPDLYQGDELWDLALVDPDNRRAVDYSRRQCLLDEVVAAMEAPQQASREFLYQLVEAPEDGRLKLHVIHALLRARRDYPDLFTASSYEPLHVDGPLQDHLVGFVRTQRDRALITVVSRWTTSLVKAAAEVPVGSQVWPVANMIRLPDGLNAFRWKSVLTQSLLTHPFWRFALRDPRRSCAGIGGVAHLGRTSGRVTCGRARRDAPVVCQSVAVSQCCSGHVPVL